VAIELPPRQPKATQYILYLMDRPAVRILIRPTYRTLGLSPVYHSSQLGNAAISGQPPTRARRTMHA
jgi:hypothetical protein